MKNIRVSSVTDLRSKFSSILESEEQTVLWALEHNHLSINNGLIDLVFIVAIITPL